MWSFMWSWRLAWKPFLHTPASLKAHTPQIWGVKIHPPNLGGESSKNTYFTVFPGTHSLNLGVKSSPPKFGGYGLSGMMADGIQRVTATPAPWGVRPHGSPAPGAAKPRRCWRPHLKTGFPICLAGCGASQLGHGGHPAGRVCPQISCEATDGRMAGAFQETQLDETTRC